jgi:Ca-activated chloride channel family protein
VTWGTPHLLLLLLLAPAVLALGLRAWRANRQVLRAIFALDLGTVHAGVQRRRGWQLALAVLAVAGMAAAAGGPRWGFDWQQQKTRGVSIVVVLDVSRSMDAQDVSPSRMERARRELRDFVGLLTGDGVGLVVFAAGAFMRVPITVDYDTFLWAVDDSSTGTIAAQGSSLAGALDAATRMLVRSSGKGKAIVLLSDGELADDQAALDAPLAKARGAGVRVYALGIGETSGAPIPLPEGGFKEDKDGNVVVSRLDEDALRWLAEATGGAYVRAVPSDADMRAIVLDEIHGHLEAGDREFRREKVWHERYQWPLAGALAALALSAILGIRPRRSGLAMVVALGLVASTPASAGALQDGMDAYRRGDWGTAAEKLGQARVDRPHDAELGRALAESLYRAGRFREAEPVWDSLAAADPPHAAVYTYNAGNAAYRGGRLADAVERFEAASKADPKLEAAAKNAEAVKKEIALRMKEQQEQQQQDQQEDDRQQQQEPGQPQQQDEGRQDQGQEQEQQDQGQQPQDPGERQEDGQEAQQGQVDTDAADNGDQAAEGAAPRGEMSPEEAARLVDGVPDGKPRVVVGGSGDERDW